MRMLFRPMCRGFDRTTDSCLQPFVFPIVDPFKTLFFRYDIIDFKYFLNESRRIRVPFHE